MKLSGTESDPLKPLYASPGVEVGIGRIGIGRMAMPCRGPTLDHLPRPEERVLLSPVDDKEMVSSPMEGGVAVEPNVSVEPKTAQIPRSLGRARSLVSCLREFPPLRVDSNRKVRKAVFCKTPPEVCEHECCVQVTFGKAVNILENENGEVNAVGDADTLPFPVVLDSSAAEHVADSIDAPGYSVDPSPVSRAGAGFIAANGERIPNRGQMCLQLDSPSGVALNSAFQVCKTTRPLWSVGRICDSACTVTFDANGATVKHIKSGRELCTFERSQGLYVGKVELRKPSGGFAGQGS